MPDSGPLIARLVKSAQGGLADVPDVHDYRAKNVLIKSARVQAECARALAERDKAQAIKELADAVKSLASPAEEDP